MLQRRSLGKPLVEIEEMELGKRRVIVPLSGQSMASSLAHDLITKLGKEVWGFKLHPTKVIRFYYEGYDVIEDCKRHNVGIFMDLKGFDIPSEVADMISDLETVGGIDLITIHCSGGREMFRKALEARKNALLLGVTVLTSMKAITTHAVYNMERNQRIIDFAKAAFQTGLDGTVSSAADLSLIKNERKIGKEKMIRVTPGIRWQDETVQGDDQDRVLTPQRARTAGADLLVIGRPIIRAKDPVAAAIRANNEFWSEE